MHKTLRLSLLMAGVVSVTAGCQPGHRHVDLHGQRHGLFSHQSRRGAARLGQGAGGGWQGLGAGNTAELYNPYNDVWLPVPPCPVTGAGLSATLLYSGEVLVTGNGTANAALYDPSTNTWLPTTPMQQSRTEHAAVLLDTGEVLVTGGGANGSFTPTSTVERFKR